MYMKNGTLYRVFAVRMQLKDPQQTEEVLAAVQEKLADIATERLIESPLVTYDRELEINTNVILNFYLHLSNPSQPEKVRLSEVLESLTDSEEFEVLSVKLE